MKQRSLIKLADVKDLLPLLDREEITISRFCELLNYRANESLNARINLQRPDSEYYASREKHWLETINMKDKKLNFTLFSNDSVFLSDVLSKYRYYLLEDVQQTLKNNVVDPMVMKFSSYEYLNYGHWVEKCLFHIRRIRDED